jgi:hypothetical protein
MPVSFTYTHPDISSDVGKQPAQRTLNLRFNPTNVNWTYNVNTQNYDTYGGQVIQVLSVSINQLIIEGQLGREGAFGVRRASSAMTDPRTGGPVAAGGFYNNPGHLQFEYNGVTYPGLHALAEFFREYFAVVSQGGDPQNPGRYIQVPMTLNYGNTYSDIVNGRLVTGKSEPYNGTRTWSVVPKSFPSFRRSNENFAPEWRVECEVIEADSKIIYREKQSAIARLQEAVGYSVKNPFSDPLANPNSSASNITDKIVSQWKAMLPAMTQGDLENMVWQDITVPNVTENVPIPEKVVSTQTSANNNVLDGEIGALVDRQLDPFGALQQGPTVRTSDKNQDN